MSPSLLIEWINDPKLLDRQSLVQLRSLISTYPCFTPARVLYLKNLNQQNDLRFSGELNRIAISVPDRKRLFYFMEDRIPKIEGVNLKNKPLAISSFSIIDHFLHNSTKSPEVVASKSGQKKKTNTDRKDEFPKTSMKVERIVSTDTYPKFGGDGFALDYLSYLSIYPKTEASATTSVSPAKCEEELKSEPMKGQDLIDAFLSNPSVENQFIGTRERDDSVNARDELFDEGDKFEAASETHVKDIPEATFTETLAKIYLKQKRYDRALEIIKSLSLKYPEKNVYFADQIRFLEKLIINTKKQ